MRRRDVDVLLVEDDEAIRETLAEVLGEEGYIVATAVHGAHALERLSSGLRPQLILCDLMMPVMDGWQLVRALHASDALRAIPIIVVSAARVDLPVGARQYLHKPLDLEALLAAIEQQCRGQAPGADEAGSARRCGPPPLQQAAGGR